MKYINVEEARNSAHISSDITKLVRSWPVATLAITLGISIYVHQMAQAAIPLIIRRILKI